MLLYNLNYKILPKILIELLFPKLSLMGKQFFTISQRLREYSIDIGDCCFGGTNLG